MKVLKMQSIDWIACGCTALAIALVLLDKWL